MQKKSREARRPVRPQVLRIIGKLPTVFSERKEYEEAITAAKQATEKCSRLHHQIYRGV